MANFLAVAIVSVFTQSGAHHRARFHQELAVRTSSRSEIFIMVIVMLVWAFLAFGPGPNLAESFYGNWAVPQTWTFGLLPSLWVWQLCWWFIGMFVLYCAARVFCVRKEDA